MPRPQFTSLAFLFIAGMATLAVAQQPETTTEKAAKVFQQGTFLARKHPELLTSKIFGRPYTERVQGGRFGQPYRLLYGERTQSQLPYVYEIGYNHDQEASYFLVSKAALERNPTINDLETQTILHKVAWGGKWAPMKTEGMQGDAWEYTHTFAVDEKATKTINLKFFAFRLQSKRQVLVYTQHVSPNLGGDTGIPSVLLSYAGSTVLPLTGEATSQNAEVLVVNASSPIGAVDSIEKWNAATEALQDAAAAGKVQVVASFSHSGYGTLASAIAALSDGTGPKSAGEATKLVEQVWSEVPEKNTAFAYSLGLATLTKLAAQKDQVAAAARTKFGSEMGVSSIGIKKLTPVEVKAIEKSDLSETIIPRAKELGIWPKD